MKLNSKRFLGFQEYQSILLFDVTPTISLSQFVYTACDWLKAVGGKDGWEFQQPMGVATRSGQAHAF